MATSKTVVVNIPDDDDDQVVATAFAVTPPSSRNRKRFYSSASAPIDLDNTPPPLRRRPSSAPKPPVHVLDADTDPSLVPDDDVAETPDSVLVHLGSSQKPELDELPDIVVVGTPGFTSPCLNRQPAARGSLSAGLAQKSTGTASPILVDDDDGDDAIYRELTGSPSYETDQNEGTTTYGKPLHADFPHEDSTLCDADVGPGKNGPWGAKKHQKEEEKLKRQEANRLKDEEKAKQAEERKQKKQENKVLKETMKAELAEKKKEKEVAKWKSGKYALQCITTLVDTNVADSGSIGDLHQALDNKGLKKKVIKNPIARSIFWNIEVPKYIAQELFSINDGYDMIFCKLATHYTNVHSRQCINEAKVAEHLVGLTCSLAECKFRKQSSWLSVHANGAIVPNGFIHKDLAKKDTWMKSLIAIPGVQPKNAFAIWKEYRCMRSLLNVYLDPNKTVAEKELLLSDLKSEDTLGNERKRLGPKCSRRVYRMLMAENGDLNTDSAEVGA